MRTQDWLLGPCPESPARSASVPQLLGRTLFGVVDTDDIVDEAVAGGEGDGDAAHLEPFVPP